MDPRPASESAAPSPSPTPATSEASPTWRTDPGEPASTRGLVVPGRRRGQPAGGRKSAAKQEAGSGSISDRHPVIPEDSRRIRRHRLILRANRFALIASTVNLAILHLTPGMTPSVRSWSRTLFLACVGWGVGYLIGSRNLWLKK
jgi:hypothetical protein